MSTTGVKPSGKLTYAHGSAVVSGQLLILDTKFAIIAAGAYGANEEGTYYYADQHKITKKTGTGKSFAIGDSVFVDTSASNAADTTGVYVGMCTATAGESDTTVRVDLNFGYNDTDT